MLPRRTHTRSAREAAKGKQGGRTQEIQRLIGRSLRASWSSGRWRAHLHPRLRRPQADGAPAAHRSPAATWRWRRRSRSLLHGSAMSSCRARSGRRRLGGHRQGDRSVLDLDYEEDTAAEVDMNIVATGEGQWSRSRAPRRRESFARRETGRLVEAGLAATRLIEAQKPRLRRTSLLATESGKLRELRAGTRDRTSLSLDDVPRCQRWRTPRTRSRATPGSKALGRPGRQRSRQGRRLGAVRRTRSGAPPGCALPATRPGATRTGFRRCPRGDGASPGPGARRGVPLRPRPGLSGERRRAFRAGGVPRDDPPRTTRNRGLRVRPGVPPG